MTPSERIRIIKSIAGRLQPEQWSIIDLTLHQYNLSTSNVWQGEKFDYVLSMIENADDAVLVALYNHLGYDENKSGSSDITPSFWGEGAFRLFVSHLADHKDEATKLKMMLNTFGISCFIAHRDIEPSMEWMDEIELGLRTCDALISLMRPGFHASKWTDQEIGCAMGRELLVFSVRLGEDPYGFIGRFQAIPDLPLPAMAAKIFEVLVTNKKTKKIMSRAILHQFSQSDTYALAKNNMDLIERLTYWDQELERLILEAVTSNDQIRGSWGVESRVIAFNEKWTIA